VDYQLVYDLSDMDYKWGFPAIGLILVAAGAVIMIASRGRSAFAMSYFWSSLLLTVIAFIVSYYNYSSLVAEKMAGRVNIVEGIVTNFRPAPAGAHARERFCVETSCFEYSRYDVMGGFNNTVFRGGRIIRDGLPVRVWHVGNTIVRLEMAQSEERKELERCLPPFLPRSCL
jgi:hypothetical protein